MSGALRAHSSTTSRQNSKGRALSKASSERACSAREGMAPPDPGAGYQRRRMCWRARTMAASNRMMLKCRATWRMRSLTAALASGLRKSIWAVSFQAIPRAVVAVVDVADLARVPVEALEDDGRVRAGVIMVLEPDADRGVVRKVGGRQKSSRGKDSGPSPRRGRGASLTHSESMPVWLGTMSAASRIPFHMQRSRSASRASQPPSEGSIS